jgi:predicted metal-dependent hydrolase
VRDYKHQVTDPELIEEVKDFTFQEGQHSRVHRRYNDRLKAQGVKVDKIEQNQRELIAWSRSKFPRKNTLAETAAAEHITAMMAEFILDNPAEMRQADPRICAIYFWHAIEETEHKAVAFDVLQKVAGAGYFTRIMGLVVETFLFPFFIFQIMRHMLRVDGFTRGQRLKLWAKGLWWLYGRVGCSCVPCQCICAITGPAFTPGNTRPPAPSTTGWPSTSVRRVIPSPPAIAF